VKLDNIDIDETLKEVEKLLNQEKNLSPTLHAMIKLLITLLKVSSNRIGLNSRNSSTKSRLHEESHPQVIPMA